MLSGVMFPVLVLIAALGGLVALLTSLLLHEVFCRTIVTSIPALLLVLFLGFMAYDFMSMEIQIKEEELTVTKVDDIDIIMESNDPINVNLLMGRSFSQEDIIIKTTKFGKGYIAEDSITTYKVKE